MSISHWRFRLLLLLSAALLVLPGSAAAQGAPALRVLDSPFRPAEVQGFAGALQIEHGHETWELLREIHRGGELLELRGFALPGGLRADLRLRPLRISEPGAVQVEMTAQGPRLMRPTAVLFTGAVPGVSSDAFLAVAAGMLHGWVRLEGRLYFVSSARRGSGTWVTDAGALPHSGAPALAGGDWCRSVSRLLEQQPLPGGRANGAAPVVQVADLFLELDHEFRAIWNDSVMAADYALTLFGAMSAIYRRDLGAQIRVPSGYLRIWTMEPPWGTVTTFQDIVTIREWWASDMNLLRDLPRAGVHVLTNPVFGGVAYLPAVCSLNYGYALSSVFGSFPNPVEHTSSSNWDLMVVSHETGHNFGSPHTFDFDPPIACNDGSGPDNGTIMSYCHQEPGGMVNIGLRFHAVVQDQVRWTLEQVSCLEPVPFAMGDYDLDGAVTAADLAALDATLVQGFESAGCRDAFDLDADGLLTACDRQMLAALVGGGLELTHGTLVPGQTTAFSAHGLEPGERAFFLYSLAGAGCGGPCPGKLGGMCLDLLAPVQLLGDAVADATGRARIGVRLPLSTPQVAVGLQAVVRRGDGGAESVKSNVSVAQVQ